MRGFFFKGKEYCFGDPPKILRGADIKPPLSPTRGEKKKFFFSSAAPTVFVWVAPKKETKTSPPSFIKKQILRGDVARLLIWEFSRNNVLLFLKEETKQSRVFFVLL